MTHFIIAYHISLVNIQTNYCNNNLLILNVKQLNKIKKLYYFYTSKALWDGQGKIKMYYEMSRVKKQLSRKRSVDLYACSPWGSLFFVQLEISLQKKWCFLLPIFFSECEQIISFLRICSHLLKKSLMETFLCSAAIPICNNIEVAL